MDVQRIAGHSDFKVELKFKIGERRDIEMFGDDESEEILALRFAMEKELHFSKGIAHLGDGAEGGFASRLEAVIEGDRIEDVPQNPWKGKQHDAACNRE